ncbi:PIR Superfamily Protein [Plasmodium ovale curtisi]|uniref:PIR Superfamily Protein n=1 Tax=Plasmodium ovale curtisi TaxID=864141 RepID=A0A1A8WPD2_PLAOA|nr:PIR Superfamily Protein [Plasmodium ovale curtisi]
MTGDQNTWPCPKWPNNNMYAFLDNIDEYEPILENAEKITAVKEISIDDIISEKYPILEDYLCTDDKAVSCETLLNDAISFQFLSPHIICEKFKSINKSLEEKLNNIESYHLENMKILFDLYKIKDKIYSIISEGKLTDKNSSWLEHKNERNKKYKEGIIKCRDGCDDFHNALKQFKYHDSVIKEYNREKLKSITTVSFLVPVIGLLFMLMSSNMFLPIQHNLLEKIKNAKNKLFTVEEREKELLSYTSYNNNRINDEEDYNIGYYSVRNF